MFSLFVSTFENNLWIIIQCYLRDFSNWKIDEGDVLFEEEPWRTLASKMEDFLVPPRSSPLKAGSQDSQSLLEDSQSRAASPPAVNESASSAGGAPPATNSASKGTKQVSKDTD